MKEDRFTLMSDCPEIQGRWVPKVGDWTNLGLLIGISQLNGKMPTYWIETGESTIECKRNELKVYPTGDDLWEMLPDRCSGTLDYTFGTPKQYRLCLCTDQGDATYIRHHTGWCNTCKEALIQGVMYECHGKVWKDKGGWQDV